VPDVIEAILTTYKELRRVGQDAFKAAANAARHPAAEAQTA